MKGKARPDLYDDQPVVLAALETFIKRVGLLGVVERRAVAPRRDWAAAIAEICTSLVALGLLTQVSLLPSWYVVGIFGCLLALLPAGFLAAAATIDGGWRWGLEVGVLTWIAVISPFALSCWRDPR